MKTKQKIASFLESDLAASRDLGRSEKAGFALIVGWHEKWHVSQGLPSRRDSLDDLLASEGEGEGAQTWQLDQWAEHRQAAVESVSTTLTAGNSR